MGRFFSLRTSGTIHAPHHLALEGAKARCPMPQPKLDRSGAELSAWAILESQEPLPPYELDRRCNLTLRLRVGEVIARAMQRVSKRRLGNVVRFMRRR
jgi:hypothetical protein